MEKLCTHCHKPMTYMGEWPQMDQGAKMMNCWRCRPCDKTVKEPMKEAA